MGDDQETRETLIDVLKEAIFDSRLWLGADDLDVHPSHLLGVVVLYVLSSLSFGPAIDWLQRPGLGRYIGFILFALSLVCWLGALLILLRMAWQLGLRRLVLFLGVGVILLAVAMTLLSGQDQSLEQGVMSTAETIFSRLDRWVRKVAVSQVQALLEFQRVSQAAPATDATAVPVSTPNITREPARPLASAEPTLAPQFSLAPIAATPRAVAAGQAPLAIDFLVEGLESAPNSIKLNIAIKRQSDATLAWTSDQGRKNEIYLTAGLQRYNLIDMGGIFVQNTTLQPMQLYKGWFRFTKPVEDTFIFCYPDIEPLQINSGF